MKERPQPIQDKSKDSWILSFPVLGLASDEEGLMLACGGGGKSYKELPNVIEAFRFVNKDLISVGFVDTGPDLCVGISYNPELRWWICHVTNGAQIYTFDETGFQLKLKFETETEATKDGMWLNATHMIGYFILTGGTDGVVRRWSTSESGAVLSSSYKADAGEIKDVCFSASMDFVASSHAADKCIRIWDTSSGTARHLINWEKFKPCRIQWLEDELLVLASGVPRGPTKLRLYSFDAEPTVKKEILVHKIPASSMSVSYSTEFILICIASAVKIILSRQLKVIKKTGEMHEMPISASCFLHPDVPVSGSGDYVIHRGPRACKGGNTLVYLFFMILFLWMFYSLLIKLSDGDFDHFDL